MSILTTARTSIREFTTADACFVLELMNEPAYLEFIGDRGVTNVALAETYITEKFMASYAQLGFGFWIVERLEDGEPIGMCGLAQRDFLDAPDIGFAFLSRFRRQGYGSESATGVLKHARNALHLSTVLAFADPNNEASASLLTAIGMQDQGLRYFKAFEEDLRVFEIRFA